MGFKSHGNFSMIVTKKGKKHFVFVYLNEERVGFLEATSPDCFLFPSSSYKAVYVIYPCIEDTRGKTFLKVKLVGQDTQRIHEQPGKIRQLSEKCRCLKLSDNELLVVNSYGVCTMKGTVTKNGHLKIIESSRFYFNKEKKKKVEIEELSLSKGKKLLVVLACSLSNPKE